jgi:hypothetical protein
MPYKSKQRNAKYRAAYDARRALSGADRARRYGLSIERLNEMLASGCAAKDFGDCAGELQIDHNHLFCDKARSSCGKCVRGILCRKHNTSLGHIELDPAFTAWAIASYASSFDAKNQMPSKIDWAKLWRRGQ